MLTPSGSQIYILPGFYLYAQYALMTVRFLDADRIGPIGVLLRPYVSRIRAERKDQGQQRIYPEN